MEPTGTNRRNWLMLIKNYICFGVSTSDPLLFAAKLIVYVTQVHIFLPFTNSSEVKNFLICPAYERHMT